MVKLTFFVLFTRAEKLVHKALALSPIHSIKNNPSVLQSSPNISVKFWRSRLLNVHDIKFLKIALLPTPTYLSGLFKVPKVSKGPTDQNQAKTRHV